VELTAPVAHLGRGFDHRGWAFGLGCSLRPEIRYACRGEFTARGLEAAVDLLADLFRDYLAVRRHEGEVDAACRRTRQELDALHRDFEARKGPPHQDRAALRRAFRAGGLTQSDYQRRLKGLGRELMRIERERWDAERAAGGRFAAWAEACCGRRVGLDEAERLLTEPALVVLARPDEGQGG